MHHDLKSREPHFTNVCLGIKPMEVRRDDRDFQTNDTVTYHQFVDGEMTGRKVGPFVIGLVIRHCDFPDGIQPGFCVYSHRIERFCPACGWDYPEHSPQCRYFDPHK